MPLIGYRNAINPRSIACRFEVRPEKIFARRLHEGCIEPERDERSTMKPINRTSRVRFERANVSAWCSHSPWSINPIISHLKIRSMLFLLIAKPKRNE
jgi:hypothetical protein